MVFYGSPNPKIYDIFGICWAIRSMPHTVVELSTVSVIMYHVTEIMWISILSIQPSVSSIMIHGLCFDTVKWCGGILVQHVGKFGNMFYWIKYAEGFLLLQFLVSWIFHWIHGQSCVTAANESIFSQVIPNMLVINCVKFDSGQIIFWEIIGQTFRGTYFFWGVYINYNHGSPNFESSDFRPNSA